MLKDLESAWDALSREVMLQVDEAGRVTWADERTLRKLGVKPGARFSSLAAPGTEAKADGLCARGRVDEVKGSEIPLVVGGAVSTFTFRATPDGRGGALLCGLGAPSEQGILLQMQESMGEVVTLNRQIARQKRELEHQHGQLERAYRDLDESNRGVITLHGELAEKADTLRRTSEVKSRVVANVSHEFRTPLHTILGLSKLLLDSSDGPLTDEQRKQVGFIRTSAQELHDLVSDMLDLSKAESGRAILRPERFLLPDLMASMRGMLRPLLPADSQVKLVFEPPDEATQLFTDQGKLAQILRNLISNALKFTERGEVRVTATVTDGVARFGVKDTGIGIDPGNFDRIFEEFGQIENPLQRKVKGTGLGLALSRRLAEMLGGTLTVQSALNEGAAFTLTIPALHPEADELEKMERRPLDDTKSPVLVVEDDRKTIFLYEKYLSMAGFQVVPARNTESARKLLEQLTPSAIVLDIMLEGESTWEFLAQLKREPRTSDIPVLVVTVTNKEQKARALGADEFWLKPVDQDRLLRKLRTLSTNGGGRVLVIDDDEKARYLMRKFLDKTPYELLEAGTGKEGVELAREQRPHVILLDFLLQGETAFDVLDELKADPRTRSIPVIIVTSHLLAPQERQRLSEDTESILSKDSLSRELAINRIRDALAKASKRVTP